MQWRNDEAQFGTVTIVLHWVAAACVLAMLFTAAGAWLAPDEDTETRWMVVHGTIGVVVWLILAVRIIWHFVEQRPDTRADQPGLNQLARGVHVLLLLLLATQMLTGPIDVWTGGWPISVGNWFTIPSPLGSAFKAWHDPIGSVHRYTGYAIALILTFHIGGALKHLLIDRDRTVHRMLGLGREPIA